MVLQLFKVHEKIDYRGNHFEMLEISTFQFHLLAYFILFSCKIHAEAPCITG